MNTDLNRDNLVNAVSALASLMNVLMTKHEGQSEFKLQPDEYMALSPLSTIARDALFEMGDEESKRWARKMYIHKHMGPDDRFYACGYWNITHDLHSYVHGLWMEARSK